MRCVIAAVGTVVLGYLWVLLYNYASGFEDVFLLGSIAAAGIGGGTTGGRADA